MKTIGVILAICVLVVIVWGAGYGLVSGYELITTNWSALDAEWQSILVVMATMIILAALFITLVLSRVTKREGARSVGRTEAYNAFVSWYSMFNQSGEQLPDAASLVQTKNRIMLWGSNRVVQHINQLYDQLVKGDADTRTVAEKAGHVFLEIKRELGHRNPSVDRSII